MKTMMNLQSVQQQSQETLTLFQSTCGHKRYMKYLCLDSIQVCTYLMT